MRRLVLALLGLTLLALPASSQALRSTPGDGTFAVLKGNGAVAIVARGAVLGRFDSGKVIIDDPDPNDGDAPVVFGAESRHDVTDTKSIYSGTDVRFKVIGGFFRVRVVAQGINLSAVGRGFVVLAGGGFLDNGLYSLNGGDYSPLPDTPTKLPLGQPPGPALPPGG